MGQIIARSKVLKKSILIMLLSILAIFTLFGSACNENYPESKTFIVADRKSFQKIISNDFTEFEVDFDKEMILVYTFATEYVLPAKLDNVELNDKTLRVNYNIEHIRYAPSARRPFQRWFVVKLDKLDITSVESSVSDVFTDDESLTEDILPYNAKIYDNCGSWIKEKFQTKNRVEGAVYE